MNTMKAKMFRILKIHSPLERKPLCYSFIPSPSERGEIPKLLFSFPPKEERTPSSNILREITLSPGRVPEPGWYITHGKDHQCWGQVTQGISQGFEAEIFRETSLYVSSHIRFLPPIMGGVVTVSDKGSRGERKDTSGPALKDFLQELGVTVLRSTIVPDESEEIRKTLEEWTEENQCHLVVLTGGTGLSSRDVTPEVLLHMGEKIVPGLGEYMRLSSAAENPRAILSRSLGVLRKKSLLICLPGSRRGALECVRTVAPALRHAVEIAQGWGGECGHDHS
jgi:molybdenum cofactor synthesis domain-containing protein